MLVFSSEYSKTSKQSGREKRKRGEIKRGKEKETAYNSTDIFDLPFRPFMSVYMRSLFCLIWFPSCVSVILFLSNDILTLNIKIKKKLIFYFGRGGRNDTGMFILA